MKSKPRYYSAITMHSCIGKLFTSVLNNRLDKYLEEYGLLAEEQAGYEVDIPLLIIFLQWIC